jgi:hypothetical protein
MGQPEKNFTIRLEEELRSPIKLAAKRFRLSESDIARILIARGIPLLRKKSITLQANALQTRTA